MQHSSKGGFWDKLGRMIQYTARLRIPLYASHATFFIILSAFPMLVLLLCLVRYTGLQVETLTELLDGVIPAALMPAAKKLIYNTYQNTSSVILSLSLLTALWSASRGIHGLHTGLNAIYGVTENRNYFYTRALSLLYTFAFVLVLLLTLVVHVFGNSVLHLLHLTDMLPLGSLSNVLNLRFFVLLAVQTLLFATMFSVLPNKRNRFWQSLPGALFASLGWLVFSGIYSAYVERFTRYATIYGSVYAVALSMLWLYFCISIVFYGGALNNYLIRRRK